jgi:hypothetical protein
MGAPDRGEHHQVAGAVAIFRQETPRCGVNDSSFTQTEIIRSPVDRCRPLKNLRHTPVVSLHDLYPLLCPLARETNMGSLCQKKASDVRFFNDNTLLKYKPILVIADYSKKTMLADEHIGERSRGSFPRFPLKPIAHESETKIAAVRRYI